MLAGTQRRSPHSFLRSDDFSILRPLSSSRMAVMDPLRRQRLLTGGFVLAVVFVGALSMHMERLLGWGLFILCFFAGTLGGLGFLWAKNQVLLKWNLLSKSRRIIFVLFGVALFLLYMFISNRHKPEEDFRDVMACLVVLGLLMLWGLYRLFSIFVDTLYAR